MKPGLDKRPAQPRRSTIGRMQGVPLSAGNYEISTPAGKMSFTYDGGGVIHTVSGSFQCVNSPITGTHYVDCFDSDYVLGFFPDNTYALSRPGPDLGGTWKQK